MKRKHKEGAKEKCSLSLEPVRQILWSAVRKDFPPHPHPVNKFVGISDFQVLSYKYHSKTMATTEPQCLTFLLADFLSQPEELCISVLGQQEVILWHGHKASVASSCPGSRVWLSCLTIWTPNFPFKWGQSHLYHNERKVFNSVPENI